jgi:hypothetical protein
MSGASCQLEHAVSTADYFDSVHHTCVQASIGSIRFSLSTVEDVSPGIDGRM